MDPIKCSAEKKTPWWNWCPPEHKVFFACKAISLNKIWCSYRRYVVIWNNSKNPTRYSTSGRGEDFGPWGTVFGSFGSQNVYLNALNPLAHLVIFLTCTLQMKNAELLGPLPTPLTSHPPYLTRKYKNFRMWPLINLYHPPPFLGDLVG